MSFHHQQCMKPMAVGEHPMNMIHPQHSIAVGSRAACLGTEAASQELATRNYSMAREFLDKQESAQMSTLMLTCHLPELAFGCQDASTDLGKCEQDGIHI